MDIEELKTKQKEYKEVYAKSIALYDEFQVELRSCALELFEEGLDGLSWSLKEADEDGLRLSSHFYTKDKFSGLLDEALLHPHSYYGIDFDTVYGHIEVIAKEGAVLLFMPWSKVPEHIQKFEVRDFEYQLKIQLLDVEKSLASRRRWVCECENTVREIKALIASIVCS